MRIIFDRAKGQAQGFLFSAESCSLYPGRSPGSKTTLTCRPLSFPVGLRVVMLAVHLCLQWRDRAGFSPDFPFKPMWAPWVYTISITQREGKLLSGVRHLVRGAKWSSAQRDMALLPLGKPSKKQSQDAPQHRLRLP